MVWAFAVLYALLTLALCSKKLSDPVLTQNYCEDCLIPLYLRGDVRHTHPAPSYFHVTGAFSRAGNHSAACAPSPRWMIARPHKKGRAMAQSFTGKKRIRKSFGKIAEAVTMPNLIEVQKSSYDQFLQKDVPQEMRRDEGIEAVFKS
eukprot:gene40679-64618_t